MDKKIVVQNLWVEQLQEQILPGVIDEINTAVQSALGEAGVPQVIDELQEEMAKQDEVEDRFLEIVASVTEVVKCMAAAAEGTSAEDKPAENAAPAKKAAEEDAIVRQFYVEQLQKQILPGVMDEINTSVQIAMGEAGVPQIIGELREEMAKQDEVEDRFLEIVAGVTEVVKSMAAAAEAASAEAASAEAASAEDKPTEDAAPAEEASEDDDLMQQIAFEQLQEQILAGVIDELNTSVKSALGEAATEAVGVLREGMAKDAEVEDKLLEMVVGMNEDLKSMATAAAEAEVVEDTMELFFNVDYYEIDHEEFKVEVKNGLKDLGCSEEHLEKVTVELRPGSVIAEVSGPADTMGAVKDCEIDNLSVMGIQAFTSFDKFEVFVAEAKAAEAEAAAQAAVAEAAAAEAAAAEGAAAEAAAAEAAAAEAAAAEAAAAEAAAAEAAAAEAAVADGDWRARIQGAQAKHPLPGIEFFSEDEDNATQALHFQEIRELIRQRDEAIAAAATPKTPEEASELEEMIELLEAALQEAREEYVEMYDK